MSTNGSNGNGQNKGLLWITGAILGPMFLATFGLLLNTTVTSTQKIAALEVEFKAIRHDLNAIETKLDRLLEPRHK